MTYVSCFLGDTSDIRCMAIDMAGKFLLTILGSLNEAQSRWYVAREAIARGWGGIKAMEELTCPPGTSKWNKIEHQMFSFISINWQGKPLVDDYETVVNLIGGTSTKSGLRIKARLDTKEYEKGEEFTDKQMATIDIKRHRTHPNWNYTIASRKT